MIEEKISEWSKHASKRPGELLESIIALKNLLENELRNHSSDYFLSRVIYQSIIPISNNYIA